MLIVPTKQTSLYPCNNLMYNNPCGGLLLLCQPTLPRTGLFLDTPQTVPLPTTFATLQLVLHQKEGCDATFTST